MPIRVSEKTYYSAQHVTGPSAVLVTLRFGTKPENGPYVIKKSPIDGESEVQHDVERFLDEVNQGIEKAKREFKKEIEVEEIQIVTDDFPAEGQVAHVTYGIAKHYLEKVLTRR